MCVKEGYNMDKTFEMWSTFHYFMMIFPFVMAITLYFIFRNKSERTKQWVAILLGFIMLIILILRNVYIFDKRGGLNPEVIPFQVCHFANIIVVFAAVSKKKIYRTIFWCLNFPAGLVSVIFADGLENYSNIWNMQGIAYISGHMLIVVVGLYMLLVKMIEIDFKTFKQMLKVIGVFYILSVFINNWFNHIFSHTNTDANYFYTYKPESGTPLESFFNLGNNINLSGFVFNPIYLLLLAFAGLIIFIIFYGLYLLRNIFN